MAVCYHGFKRPTQSTHERFLGSSELHRSTSAGKEPRSTFAELRSPKPATQTGPRSNKPNLSGELLQDHREWTVYALHALISFYKLL